MGRCSVYSEGWKRQVGLHLIHWHYKCFLAPLALNEAKVEIRIQFKDVSQGIFKNIARNELVIRIQPSEATYLKVNSKTPGLYTRVIPTEMDLTYQARFAGAKIPEAYEALILDCLRGDHSNFVRHDELEVAWKVVFLFTLLKRWLTCIARFSHQSCTG